MFRTNVKEKNARDGDARSPQPLKIQHSSAAPGQLPVAVATASSPAPSLAGLPAGWSLTLDRAGGQTAGVGCPEC